MKKTVIIGASPNKNRYSYLATQRLKNNNYEVVPLGIRDGEIIGEKIITKKPLLSDIHTVTMYIGKKLQSGWYDYILGLNPKRVIFNPGTENGEFERILEEKDIEVVENCTLVMLATNQYCPK